MKQKKFVEQLKNPKIYDEKIDSVKFLQTHISYVSLTGKHAYKIKKPVDFGFLDFSTLEKRKKFCQKEITLNKRLCPEIYETVVPITEENGKIKINGSGKVIDYAVKMKEFPQDNLMNKLLQKGEIDEEEISKIVDALNDFYKSEKSTDEIKEFGRIKTIKENTDENFDQTKSKIGVTIDKEKYNKIKKTTNKFLEEKDDVFKKRIKNDFIKDCHGDLHTGNIVIKNNEICVFDCIEFNERFRYGDVASDIGFLAMDLDFQGSPYLSSYMIKKYVEKSGDHGIYDVLNFYKSYRAYVRGKVTGFRLDDPDIDENEKKNITKTAHKYFDLSYYYTLLMKYFLDEKEKPILFITSGLPGTGKTTIANKVSVDYCAKKVSTDEVRKEMRGIGKYEQHHDPYNTGLYSPEKMKETYERVIEKGEEQLINRKNVVLDATFKTIELTKKARDIADKTGSSFLILNTVCPEEIVKKYLKKRVRKKSISDGRWEIYVKQKEEFEQIKKDEPSLVIDISNKSFDYQLRAFNNILSRVS